MDITRLKNQSSALRTFVSIISKATRLFARWMMSPYRFCRAILPASPGDLVQVKTEKTKYIEDLLTVPVQITVKSSLEKLSRFIQLIENDEKFLVIEELVIRRINKNEPEQLECRLLVNGFIQKRKSEKLKET